MHNYDAVVAFKNEGHEYGRETYHIDADDREAASRAALTRSEASMYDDDRIPDRTRRVVSCRRMPAPSEKINQENGS